MRMKKRLKQVNEIAQSPDYKGQDIYPQVDDEEDTDYYGVTRALNQLL